MRRDWVGLVFLLLLVTVISSTSFLGYFTCYGLLEDLNKEMPVDYEINIDSNPYPETTFKPVELVDVNHLYFVRKQTQISPPSPGLLTVTGYLLYYDDLENTYHAVRNAKAELWDSDTLFDDLLVTDYTDDTGYFSLGPVDNDDGEGGTQDIYVYVYAESSACRVYDGSDTYIASFPTQSNVPDGTYDYGTWQVDSSQRGVFNIHDQIVSGNQLIDSQYGMVPPPKVTVKWYDGNTDGTHYHSGGEIHLLGTAADPDEFDDGIILHEYGHFISYTTWSTKPYRFDDSPGGAHSWAGTYSLELSWSEGWAHYLSCSVLTSQSYRDTYNGDWVEYDLETGLASYSTGGSIDGNANGEGCEASIAGILWDIADHQDDDQDTDGIGDVRDGSFGAIWRVLTQYSVSGHGVYTIHQFWNGYLDEYSGIIGSPFVRNLWAVFYEHGINKDTVNPDNPIWWWSSHTVNEWSTDNTIWVAWNASTIIDMSGWYGFSLLWTNITMGPTLPDTIVDTTDTETTSDPLWDGWWYLNIRTRDWAGNWNDGFLCCGPFKIDTEGPTTWVEDYVGTYGANGWYISSVVVTLTAVDGWNAIQYTMYSVDAGPWQTYTGSFIISTDGIHTIEYYSADDLDNLEMTRSSELRIDTTVPSTTIEVSGTLGGPDWYDGPITITLSASDDTSGLFRTWYQINAGSWRLYTSPIELSEDGSYTLMYYSVDTASNSEPRHTEAFNIGVLQPPSPGIPGFPIEAIIIGLSVSLGLGLLKKRQNGRKLRSSGQSSSS